jgi:hypothetical protein
MTYFMNDLLARERRRELLEASDRYRLGHELRRPARMPTRVAVLALVWIAEATASHLDRLAEAARRSAECERDLDRSGRVIFRDGPAVVSTCK